MAAGLGEELATSCQVLATSDYYFFPFSPSLYMYLIEGL
jgi:hypothetical protein